VQGKHFSLEEAIWEDEYPSLFRRQETIEDSVSLEGGGGDVTPLQLLG